MNTETKPKVDLAPIPLSEIDFLLAVQIVVAWAGEGGEKKLATTHDIFPLLKTNSLY